MNRSVYPDSVLFPQSFSHVVTRWACASLLGIRLTIACHVRRCLDFFSISERRVHKTKLKTYFIGGLVLAHLQVHLHSESLLRRLCPGYGFYEGYDAVQGTIIRRYWAVENSWGYDDKGDNGYYYMDMDVDWEAAPMTDHAGATITSKGRVFYSGFDTTIDTFTTDFWGPNVGCQAGPNENANSCVRTKKRRSILEQDPAVTKKLRGLTGRKLMQANLLTKVIPGQENVVEYVHLLARLFCQDAVNALAMQVPLSMGVELWLFPYECM